jgi:cobalt-zinc-cadmium efflux system outer membrane protein
VTLTFLIRVIAPVVLVLWPLVLGVSAQDPPGAAFKEWTFDEIVRAALSQHPLVEAARERVTGAQGTLLTARSFANPVATYWMEKGTFPGQTAAMGLNRETSAYVTVPLEGLFQRDPRIRRADADEKSAEFALVAARRLVALNAAHAFFRVALDQIALDVAETNRQGVEQLVSYDRSRVTEGAAAEVELIRLQVELDRAITNVVFAEADLAKSRAELSPFVSADTSTPQATALRVTVPNAASARALLSPAATFTSRARDQRSEVLGANARVSAARAETALQHALTIRQVGATFGVKRVDGTNSMIAGLSMPVPLFDRNRGEKQRATSELRAAEQERAWVERVVTAEIRGAYEASERLSAQASRLESTFLDRAEEVNRITRGAYQEGAATLLQVIDAARTLADARLIYYRMVLSQRQSLFDLAMAAGDDPEVALTVSGGSDGPPARELAQRRNVQR